MPKAERVNDFARFSCDLSPIPLLEDIAVNLRNSHFLINNQNYSQVNGYALRERC